MALRPIDRSRAARALAAALDDNRTKIQEVMMESVRDESFPSFVGAVLETATAAIRHSTKGNTDNAKNWLQDIVLRAQLDDEGMT